MSEAPDRQLETLVAEAKDGNVQAFGALVGRFQKRVFYAVLKVVRDVHLADDLTQEVFLKAHRALPRLESAAYFGTWVHRIALNHAVDALKRRRRQRRREVTGDDFSWIRAPTDPALEALVDDVEGLKAALARAMKQLPEKQRLVLEMSMDPEVGHDEIAQVLGVPKGTVKSRLWHARKFLQEKLRPFLEPGS